MYSKNSILAMDLLRGEAESDPNRKAAIMPTSLSIPRSIMTTKPVNAVNIIGGGLAGCECALQLLRRGFAVNLYEMRPEKSTGAHTTGALAELVCSNSLKSEDPSTASGLLKLELQLMGCRLLELAGHARVPSGSALAVDRSKFSRLVEEELFSYPAFTLIRKEVTSLEDSVPTVIAGGPLASKALTDIVSELTGKDRLYFYDAIAPIVSFDSVDMSKAFFGGRYGKGGDDYLNLPMEKDEYEAFYNALVTAKQAELHSFDKRELFDGCMPIEEMARRGSDTIRFGPLKPVGLKDPETGRRYYAVVQLRKENVAGDCYNLVGFQTNLTYSEQKRVFSMIPALINAEFVRYGSMHRNTYVSSPGTLSSSFRVKDCTTPIYIAGQLSGVEGYVESIMSGMIAGQALAAELSGKSYVLPPEVTIVGALTSYIANAAIDFKPMNANLGILPAICGVRDKKTRKEAYCIRSLNALKAYLFDNKSNFYRTMECK